MKIFVSHADADKSLVTKFVDLLRLGIGVDHPDIFYSSQKGSIPNGEFFVQNIISELNAADFVIALLSRSYFASHFCLAEAGAALSRKAAGSCQFFSLVIPPARFSDLQGMLHGVQSGSLQDRPALGELKDRIQPNLPTVTKLPGSNIWDQKREDFLEMVAKAVLLYEAQEVLHKITVNNYQWKYEPGTAEQRVYVNYKIRINLKNGSSVPISIESAEWDSGKAGIRPFGSSPQQLKWRLKEGDQEVSSLAVPSGAVFRTWIGIATGIHEPECLMRSAARETGTMHLHLKINDHLLDHDLRF
jgi:hypothetical protein